MSDMDDGELRKTFLTLDVCRGPYDEPHKCSYLHCDYCGLCNVSEEVLSLLAQAKQAGYQEGLEAAEGCIPDEQTRVDAADDLYERAEQIGFADGHNTCRAQFIRNIQALKEKDGDI